MTWGGTTQHLGRNDRPWGGRGADRPGADRLWGGSTGTPLKQFMTYVLSKNATNVNTINSKQEAAMPISRIANMHIYENSFWCNFTPSFCHNNHSINFQDPFTGKLIREFAIS